LTAEKRVVRQVNGRPRLYWVKLNSRSRNEPLDLRVYATAALEILNVNLDRLAANLAQARRGAAR
jgi:phage terminase large subunit GpA-like protein